MASTGRPLFAPSRARLNDVIVALCALAAGLAPLVLFALISYYQILQQAVAALSETVEIAHRQIEDILSEAELELTRYLVVTEGRMTPESENLLREIVYTNPYFREAGIIDGRGFLVYSTAATIEAPIPIAPERRSDPDGPAFQIIGLMQTAVMRETSLILAMPTPDRGEINLLADPATLALFFEGIDIGPRGRLFIAGANGQNLTLHGPPVPDGAGALAERPGMLRISETSERGAQVIGEVERAWVLRDWWANLAISAPVAAIASALLILIVARIARRRSSLDHDLKLGIKRDELRLEYQPIIDTRTGACFGAEALLRWHHPVHGQIPPDVFIPLAEGTDLIEPLTEWVLRRVIAEYRPLLDQLPGMRLAINCSDALLVSRGLEQMVRRAGVPPELAANLVFEITEHALADGTEAVREAMAHLQERGFRFALDDFGVGYSSLGHLEQYAFDYLKIDRSFVRPLGAHPVTTTIFDTLVELAAKLDLVTIAEGVETEAQHHHVAERGVPLAQGWLFATLMPVEELARFLAAGPASVER